MLNKSTINHIENAIGYHFHDEQLLAQAFTRSSYHYEHLEEPSNELLEFYGDAVLSLTISDLLLEQYAARNKHGLTSVKTEGDLSAIRSALTNKVYLAEQMAKLDLQSYLRVSVGDAQRSVQNEKSVLEDLFESIIGAVFADSGKNLTIVKCVVQKVLHVTDFLSENDRKIKISYKNSLQEWCQKRGFDLPKYIPLSNADGIAECICSISALNIFERATGKNQKQAEKNAAELLFNRLQKDFPETPLKKIVTLENAINALQEYCQSKERRFPLPDYEDVADITKKDNSHEFRASCTLNGHTTFGTASKKQDARKDAALAMLKFLNIID